MNIRQIHSDKDLERYNDWVKQPGIGNFWQSLERKQYLEALGKEVRIYVSEKSTQIHASALVTIDRTIGGLSTWDISRGPIGDGRTELIDHIITDAKKGKCLAVYFSPIRMIDFGKKSTRHIHCEATRLIDLTVSHEKILKQMKQKGRYNIKIAHKHDVTVEESNDIDAFYELVKKTGKRDGFATLSKSTYQSFLDHLPGSFLLLAYDKETPTPEQSSVQGAAEPIGGVLSVIWGKRSIYYYGASNHTQRALMAPYLLQWESMQLCQKKGCTEYDLLGIAPPNADSNHPWAGISNFKEKFGGEVVLYPSERMVVLKPLMHQLLHIKRVLLK